MGRVNDYGGAARGRGPSPIIWQEIPRYLVEGRPGDGWGFFTDFLLGVSHATTGTTLSGWIASAIANPGTIQDAGEDGGAIVLAPAAADNDGEQVQSLACFTPDAISNIAFGARVKPVDADQQDIFVGLASADTAIDITGSAPTNWAGFKVVDQAADIYATNDLAAETATDTTIDAADAAYVRLEAIIRGLSTIQFYVNGVLKVTHSVVANIPSTVMAMSLATQNGEATANSLTVDWAYCYKWDK